jgi:hypothetical protein
MSSLVSRHTDRICGTISCFDRIIIAGTVPGWCHPEGMALFLSSNNIRIFDYATAFAEPLREIIRTHIEQVAKDSAVPIEYIRSAKAFRKEDRLKEIIAKRGCHHGIVHIFSAMETCPSYIPWHDKKTGRTSLKYKDAKCLHYYIYFIDAEFGLCYLRVPTWAPFRLQFYCNGHNWLARELEKAGIDFTMIDNVMTKIDDFPGAQRIADSFPAERLHRALDVFAKRYCPVVDKAPGAYHWSIMQIEYSTDIVFKSVFDLQPIYDSIIRSAIHTVKPDNVASFLGKKLDGRTTAEIGTDFRFDRRIQAMRIKHQMGWASIKMYDKIGLVLRIETTVNKVSELKHYRKVEHRDGTTETKYAPMQKTIYSIPALRELLFAANTRYLDFISSIDDPSDGERHIDRIADPVKKDDRSYRGFNLCSRSDRAMLVALLRGEGNISGVTNKIIRLALPDKTSSQISHFLRRCRLHGLIRKCGRSYKYYLTKLGKRTIIAALRIHEYITVPTLAAQHAA